MMKMSEARAAQSAACLPTHHCPPIGAFTMAAFSGTLPAWGPAGPGILFRRSPSLHSTRNTCTQHPFFTMLPLPMRPQGCH